VDDWRRSPSLSGVAAHVLDELQRPDRCERRSAAAVLVSLGVRRRSPGACTIGVWGAIRWHEPGLIAFVAIGAIVVPGYNLEWFGGVLHNVWGLALAWAAFPVLTAYFADANTLRARGISWPRDTRRR